jgi:hypothetical protein
MPRKIDHGFRMLAASVIIPSWVLSPNSATAIDSKDIPNASMVWSTMISSELQDDPSKNFKD